MASRTTVVADSLDVRPAVRQVLDAMTGAAAFVRDGCQDILAINDLGRALFAEVLEGGSRPANIARFIFTDGRAPRFLPDWDAVARSSVGALRREAARARSDSLFGLIRELSEGSDEFRMLWAAHDMESPGSRVHSFRHPVARRLTLNCSTFELPGDTGQTMVAYTADPGSDSRIALDMLAELTYHTGSNGRTSWDRR